MPKDLYQNFKHYEVRDVETVADFLDKYYRPERYRGRGEAYAEGLLRSYEQEFARRGYCFISHHDSVTGRVVSFYGRND